MLTVKDWK